MAEIVEIGIDPVSIVSQVYKDCAFLQGDGLGNTVELPEHMVVVDAIVLLAIIGPRITLSV